MKPFVVRYKKGEEDMLCVGFAATGNTVHAVLVMRDGTMAWTPVEALRVEYADQDWPLRGTHAFARIVKPA